MGGWSGLSELDPGSRARERTLRAAVLLSAWAPFATLAALLLGRSATQAADFVRRTVEFVAVLVSWLSFRRSRSVAIDERLRLERQVRLVVAVAMALSALAILTLAAMRWVRPSPTGNVLVGLIIAILGAVTNGWFWARYERFERQSPSPIVTAQARLYRAKTLVDLVVVAALGSVWVFGDAGLGRVFDLVGSVGVALYLAWSAVGQLAERSRVPVLASDLDR